MKISLYTIVRDGIYYDYHVEAMLRHHLPLVDEIVVNEGYSSDDTFERISAIDNKIKVFREKWELGTKADPLYRRCKELARRKCTGDWCILLDCDEFIPEWEFDEIRKYLSSAPKPTLTLRHTHFYGNYRVIHSAPEKVTWPVYKVQIHRNLPEMRVSWDGSNVELPELGSDAVDWDQAFSCHHFGQVRHPARLRQRWRVQHQLLRLDEPKTDRVPGFMYDLAPHDWLDPDFSADLEIFKGRSVKAVTDDPNEFVRDDFQLVRWLEEQGRG